MTPRLTIHLAVNDPAGNHTGHCEGIDVYGGAYELEPMLALRGEPVACEVGYGKVVYEESLVPQLTVTVGDIKCNAHSYKAYVGNLIWDACCISLADAARVINGVRGHGWTVEEGDSDLWDKYNSDIDDVSVEDLARAMEGEVSE